MRTYFSLFNRGKKKRKIKELKKIIIPIQRRKKKTVTDANGSSSHFSDGELKNMEVPGQYYKNILESMSSRIVAPKNSEAVSFSELVKVDRLMTVWNSLIARLSAYLNNQQLIETVGNIYLGLLTTRGSTLL